MDGGLTGPDARDPGASGAAAELRVLGMPPLSRLPMPEQDIRHFDAGAARAVPRRSFVCRRVAVLGGAGLVSAAAVAQMASVLDVGGLTAIEVALLLVFSINFAWVALTFTTALAGLIVRLRRPRMTTWHDGPIACRVAVALPTYNESPDRVFAAVEAMGRGVAAAGFGATFDWFVLSDTTDADVALQEQAAFREARRRLHGVTAVWYRRRLRNVARKPGNIADFCRRWGGAYDHLIVLDADSLMDPATMIELVRRIEADPTIGLIQTVPRLVAGRSLLARLQQFAGRVYGQVIATGFAWWTGTEGNFWGHNAVIRIRAFAGSAGLPLLSGRPPFGGHILSHDFVEAALMRRRGWGIVVADDLPGSYEEGPATIAALAGRDRRWCQGNLQHVRLLRAAGLHWASRLHLLTGIMSYLASPLWLALIATGLGLAVQAHFTRPDYFPDDFHLFPNWPVMDAAGALDLFGLTLAVLFSVKLIGYVDQVANVRKAGATGGPGRLALGVALEAVVSALLAPVLMLIQSGLVLSVLTGRDAGWAAQDRDGSAIDWRALWRDHRWHVAFGLALGGAAALDPPVLVLWLSPVIAPLALAVPLSAAAASVALGERLRRMGLLTVAEERNPPPVIPAAASLRPLYADVAGRAPDLGRIVSDNHLMSGHLELVDLSTARPRGEIDPVEAVAAVKVGEARSIAEALAWLKREERAAVIGAPHLLERLARLPAA